MSVNLSEAQLDQALAAIKRHGYGDFFPDPPEVSLIDANWPAVRTHLAKIDLDVYEGYDVMFSFAPKSRLNARRVALLHPYDLILYTTLVLRLRDGINNSRLPVDQNRLFSYRSEGAAPEVLYNDAPGYREFKQAVVDRVTRTPTLYVGISDIADFYPRIYQHRLVNALQAATSTAEQDHIRVLEKMLLRFSENVSYGIPIGPPASRPLGEAVLIDVDSALLSFGVDFVRFTDDYVIFARTAEDAEYGIRMLSETLFLNHGLTLQSAKTKILKSSDYVDQYLTAHTEKEEARRRLLDIIGPYDEQVSYEEMDDEQKQAIDALNLSQMLTEALAQDHNVDFNEVSFILGRLSALEKPELVPIVLGNLERLAPVARSIAVFFRRFSDLNKSIRDFAATSMLDPILKNSKYVSDYYAIWILSIFAANPSWNHADKLLTILRETRSDAVRRYAALALATAGTRAEVLTVKHNLQAASHLCRTAMMMATSKMGRDERKYLRQSLRLHDTLEKLCMS